MDKFRVCPTCGTKNPPMLIECSNCETDLTGIPVGNIISNNKIDDTKNSDKDTNKMVRICDCGAHNPVSSRKCLSCGEDISDKTPVNETEIEIKTTEKIHYIISSIDGEYAYELQSNLIVIGRENTMQEYLSTKPFVSRKHAELMVEANKLWIKSYNNTNHTYINNELIKDNEYIELKDGDIIGLGGKEINGIMQKDAAFFRVRISTCI